MCSTAPIHSYNTTIHNPLPPLQNPSPGPQKPAAADRQEQDPHADIPRETAHEPPPLQRAFLALQQLVVVRVAPRDARMARRRGRPWGHHDGERPAEVVDRDVYERCAARSVSSATRGERGRRTGKGERAQEGEDQQRVAQYAEDERGQDGEPERGK